MKPELVVDWRDSLVTLADQHFFDLMRMYLGGIKTPFNKQKLVEELAVFLRKAANREKMIKALDAMDLSLLTAVHLLRESGQEKIVRLFSGTWSFPEVYDRLMNLEERLLIYRTGALGLKSYRITPYLLEQIIPMLSFSRLMPASENNPAVFQSLVLDDLVQAALYAWFTHRSESLKVSARFKKKTIEQLSAALPQLALHEGAIPLVLSSLMNLGLLFQNDTALIADSARWKQFASLPLRERVAYLAAAAGGRVSRLALAERASGFLEFMSLLDEGSLYEHAILERLSFFLGERAEGDTPARRRTRFSELLRGVENTDGLEEDSPADQVETALAFGLLLKRGALYQVNASFMALPESGSHSGAPQGSLLVDPSFSVTVLPGFSLSELLPVVACMDVQQVQTAGQFEISRSSCNAAFRSGLTAATLTALLQERSGHHLPRSLVFSINDWFAAYASIRLHHGYVLSVDESQRVHFERNRHLADMIKEVIAPGVYLLSAGDEDEIRAIFAKASLELGPSLRSSGRAETPPFSALRCHAIIKPQEGVAVTPLTDVENLSAVDSTAGLSDLLAEMDVTPEIREALQSRIDRKIILSPEQLDPESVRPEKVEARGMDFLGKVRIAEYALASGALLEIVMDEKDGGVRVIGRPVSTEKRASDVLVHIMTGADRENEILSLGKAMMVRRIRGSIFQDHS